LQKQAQKFASAKLKVITVIFPDKVTETKIILSEFEGMAEWSRIATATAEVLHQQN